MLKGELFAQDMVRAYLEGRKVHTARPIVPQPVCYGPNITFKEHSDDFFLSAEKGWLRCRTCGNDPQYSREGTDVTHHYMPKYHPGDYMYARETFCILNDEFIAYKASPELWTEYLNVCATDELHWHPSIHMPRSAARLFFRVTRVEVMRLDDVDEQFAREDGFQAETYNGVCSDSALTKFKRFWETTYGPSARWMWVYWTEPVSKEEAIAGV